MNSQEYNERKNTLLKEHKRQLFVLAKEYAMSKVKAKIGDIISDNRATIKVDKHSVSEMFSSHPYCLWHGPEYTKAGRPRKDMARGCIRDSEIETIKQDA